MVLSDLLTNTIPKKIIEKLCKLLELFYSYLRLKIWIVLFEEVLYGNHKNGEYLQALQIWSNSG